MSELVRVVAVVGGVVLIVGMLSDAVATLIVTQGSSSFWRPTRIFYTVTWRATRVVAARLPDRAGEYSLNVYPALSLLGLLVLWLAGLVVGWSLVYWGLDQRLGGTREFGTLVYYAGTSLVTPLFGSAHGSVVRVLTLLETLTGVVTIALMISYLPALYGAYSRRESRLLTLDDPMGERITPMRVIVLNAPGGDVERLYRSFGEWELWTADVLESHVSYPMLALFRSQHVGQSWVTALGLVTDAATLASACVEGAQSREPYFLYRRGRRAILEISARLHLPRSEGAVSWLNEANFDLAWNGLVEAGLPLRDKAAAWADLQVRGSYGDQLERLIDFLVAPRGFWGHSAEETVAEEVAAAASEARRRASGASGTDFRARR
ncbi:MAG TPA: hypothetical protein VMP41_11225 [Acidimicrobiales bacterium]|nr:hypothetical protein [Acidimicrobiales bacterium]